MYTGGLVRSVIISSYSSHYVLPIHIFPVQPCKAAFTRSVHVINTSFIAESRRGRLLSRCGILISVTSLVAYTEFVNNIRFASSESFTVLKTRKESISNCLSTRKVRKVVKHHRLVARAFIG